MKPDQSIDLNCDMGEFPDAIENGAQEAIMPYLSSVNVACGAHAGDETTMSRTIEQAKRWKLAVGAHPSYPDRANFGRFALDMPADAISQAVLAQVRVLAQVAKGQGVDLRHVKPHGALYNQAAGDASVARAIAVGVARWSKELVMVGLAGSVMLDVFRDAGFTVAAEAFADRRYEADGTLRARRHTDALVTDPAAAARQVVGIVEDGTLNSIDGSLVAVRADTICIHGDTAGASEIAAAVACALRARGISVRPL